MPRRWLSTNGARFLADILRDFCQVSATLEEQFERFDHAGNLSFAVLRDLLGDMMNKGQLWRLKDTAHLLLRDAENAGSSARLLDWAIGYIFHETIKLMEDAHQNQYYAPRLLALTEKLPPMTTDIAAEAFVGVVGETQSDLRRGVDRIRRLLTHARSIFHRHYQGQTNNRHLARLLHDREDLVRGVFGQEYEPFINAVYNGAPEQLYLQAAAALLEGGHYETARAAARKAATLAPNSLAVRESAQRLEEQCAEKA